MQTPRMQTRPFWERVCLFLPPEKSSCYKWRRRIDRVFDGPYTKFPVNGIQRLVNGNLFAKKMNRKNFLLNKTQNG